MSAGFAITCGMCGQSTDLDTATKGLPMDHFRCAHCKRQFRRAHQPPQRLLSGFVMPGHIVIEEIRPDEPLTWRLYDGSRLTAPPLGKFFLVQRNGWVCPFSSFLTTYEKIPAHIAPGDKWALIQEAPCN
jgi:hypothetical protein